MSIWPRTTSLPSQCEVCRHWSRARLCGDCIARFAAPVPRCRRCALRLGSALPSCGGCLREPPPFEQTACVADYAFPWDRLIGDLKFHDRVELAASLAQLLAEAAASTPRPDWVLPVPLAPRRLAERGFNQAWELARRAARLRGLAARADVLTRPVEGQHQADLPRAQRLANLRAAFVVDGRRRDVIRGARVALVDDVLTTGATAREAARTLLQAGAAAVDIWVVARTEEA